MAKYRLAYLEPYEFDDDSPSGIGDHDICWSKSYIEFEAPNNEDAGKFVDEFINREIKILGQSLHRKQVELVKVV